MTVFLLSSAMVGYVLRTLDSLRNYVCTNMGKITLIRSFFCLILFWFRNEEDKWEENAGADWNDYRRIYPIHAYMAMLSSCSPDD